MSSFRARTGKSGMFDNRWWYTTTNPFYPLYGLPNCTAYAWGRVAEYMDQAVTLPLNSAEGWFNAAQNMDYNTTTSTLALKPGMILCWYDSTGAPGHVAIVEKIDNNYNIYCSESRYSRISGYSPVEYYNLDPKYFSYTQFNPATKRLSWMSSDLVYQGAFTYPGTPDPVPVTDDSGMLWYIIGQNKRKRRRF